VKDPSSEDSLAGRDDSGAKRAKEDQGRRVGSGAPKARARREPGRPGGTQGDSHPTPARPPAAQEGDEDDGKPTPVRESMRRPGRSQRAATDTTSERSLVIDDIEWTVRAVGFGEGRSGTPLMELVFEGDAGTDVLVRRGLAVGRSLGEIDEHRLREAFTRSAGEESA
jgi:hypothetical protein